MKGRELHWDCKRSGRRFRSLKADCTDFTSSLLLIDSPNGLPKVKAVQSTVFKIMEGGILLNPPFVKGVGTNTFVQEGLKCATNQVIPDHGNRQKRQTLFNSYLLEFE